MSNHRARLPATHPTTLSETLLGTLSGNLAPGFAISGLGQLIDAVMESDRVMTFG